MSDLTEIIKYYQYRIKTAEKKDVKFWEAQLRKVLKNEKNK